MNDASLEDVVKLLLYWKDKIKMLGTNEQENEEGQRLLKVLENAVDNQFDLREVKDAVGTMDLSEVLDGDGQKAYNDLVSFIFESKEEPN